MQHFSQIVPRVCTSVLFITVVNGDYELMWDKSAVMVFSKDAVNGCWKWGEHSLPKVSSYS